MKKDKELLARMQILEIQKAALIKRWERKKKREAFCKKRSKQILSLSMQGWPRLTSMKDRLKWIDLVFEAKIEGVYSIGTANCDVIMLLERTAKEITNPQTFNHGK